MSECSTTMEPNNVTYKWILKSFKDYMNFGEPYSDKRVRLRSLSFSTSELDKDRFYLVAIIKTLTNDYDDEIVLSFYLCWKNFTKPVIIRFKLYILDNKGEKRFVTNGIPDDTVYNNFAGDGTFVKIKELEKNEAELLPNDDLILGCDIVVYGENFNSMVPNVYQRQLHESIGDQLNKLFENPLNSDFTFNVDNKEFKAHKLLLKARSPVFKAMLNRHITEKQISQCTITDVRPKIFKVLLKFIYTDKVVDTLNNNDVMALLVAADKYQLNKLKEICAALLCKRVEFNNAIQLNLLAKKFCMNNFIKFTDDFIAANRDKVSINVNIGHLAENLSIETFRNFPKIQSK